jgi:hypothetical protein
MGTTAAPPSTLAVAVTSAAIEVCAPALRLRVSVLPPISRASQRVASRRVLLLIDAAGVRGRLEDVASVYDVNDLHRSLQQWAAGADVILGLPGGRTLGLTRRDGHVAGVLTLTPEGERTRLMFEVPADAVIPGPTRTARGDRGGQHRRGVRAEIEPEPRSSARRSETPLGRPFAAILRPPVAAGDGDTTAAMTGAIAGARHGTTALPAWPGCSGWRAPSASTDMGQRWHGSAGERGAQSAHRDRHYGRRAAPTGGSSAELILASCPYCYVRVGSARSGSCQGGGPSGVTRGRSWPPLPWASVTRPLRSRLRPRRSNAATRRVRRSSSTSERRRAAAGPPAVRDVRDGARQQRLLGQDPLLAAPTGSSRSRRIGDRTHSSTVSRSRSFWSRHHQWRCLPNRSKLRVP